MIAIILLLLVTLLTNSIMDSIYSNDSFKGYGLWFSKEGYLIKGKWAASLAKYLPKSIADFLAYNVLVIFSDLWHLSKTIMILSFCLCISLSVGGVFIWLAWSTFFSPLYNLIRKW